MKILWINQNINNNTGLFKQLSLKFMVNEIFTHQNITAAIRQDIPEVVVFDFDYPGREQLSAMIALKSEFPNLPIIMLTIYHSEELAVWAFRSRLWDYIVKPFNIDQFYRSIKLLVNAKQNAANDESSTWLGEEPIPPVLGTGRFKSVRTNSAVCYIKENYALKIRLQHVAVLCHLSSFQFSRVFKKEQGLTFQQFVIQYRIKKAMELINSKGAHITEVAFSVGFNDLSYFARVFKHYVGICPSKYKAKVIPINKNNSLEKNYLKTFKQHTQKRLRGGELSCNAIKLSN